MSVFPQKYSLSYSFTGFQQSQGDNNFPGTQLDGQLTNEKASVDQIIDFLASVFETSGKLKNASVTPDQLAFTIDTTGIAVVNAIASAIAFTPTGGVTSTDLQNALAELDSKKVDKTQGAYPASAIPLTAITNLTSTNVQAALSELRLLGPQTGDLRLSIDDTVAAGWVPCNDGTIGDALSSATTLADASASALYQLAWAKFSDTVAPVTGGRGLSAAADWNAHKPMALTKMLGRALAISGAGSGLTSRAHGLATGAEGNVVQQSNLASFTLPNTLGVTGTVTSTNTYRAINLVNSVGSGGSSNNMLQNNSADGPVYTFSGSITGSVTSGGGASPLSVMQPTAFNVHAFLKL